MVDVPTDGSDPVTWRIVSVWSGDGLVPTIEDGRRPEFTFLGDGRFAGSTGCNRFFGEFTDVGDGIVAAGPIGMTMMMCPDDLMHQESDVLAALEATATIVQSAGTTTFLDASDRPLLVLEPSDVPGG
jgi:heat shock protein HslJ